MCRRLLVGDGGGHTYGIGRIRANLEIEQGLIVNDKLVFKIMRRLGDVASHMVFEYAWAIDEAIALVVGLARRTPSYLPRFERPTSTAIS